MDRCASYQCLLLSFSLADNAGIGFFTILSYSHTPSLEAGCVIKVVTNLHSCWYTQIIQYCTALNYTILHACPKVAHEASPLTNNVNEYSHVVLTTIMPEFLRDKTFRLKAKQTAIFLTERVSESNYSREQTQWLTITLAAACVLHSYSCTNVLHLCY